MSEPLRPSDDDAIDVLLAEVFGAAVPPDVSRDVLRRLHDASHTASVDAGAKLSHARPSSSLRRPAVAASRSDRRSRWLGTAVAFAALAASLLLIGGLWLKREPRLPAVQFQLAQAPEPEFSSRPAAGAPADPTTREAPPARPQPREIALAPATMPDRADVVTQSAAITEPAPETPRPSQPLGQAEPIRLVALQADERIREYWQAVGVEPSPRAASEAIAKRLAIRLGGTVDPAWFAESESPDAPPSQVSAEQIAKALRSPQHAQPIAAAWLKQISGGAIERLPQDERQTLETELAEALQGKQSFDQLLAGWVGGKRPSSSSWYRALFDGGEFAGVHRLGSITMNVDLRCIRCHDSVIESSGRQHDYWSLVSMIRRDVRRAEDGTWSVMRSPQPSAAAPVFYERRDGRQTVAAPGVPSRWLQAPLDASAPAPAVDTVPEWSETLVGSRPLARGVVNSLWRLVHDRPLHGEVADATTPPHDDALLELETMLVDDLLRSDFDIARCLALILASPATVRSIPESLLREDAWAVDPAQVDEAAQAVEAFAAAAPSPKVLPLQKRVEIAMRAVGATLEGVDEMGSLLAQPMSPPEGRPSPPVTVPTSTLGGFPDHASGPPVQWLESIDNFESQLQHLGYLAGRERLPERIDVAAHTMRQRNDDASLALHRVWWLLQP